MRINKALKLALSYKSVDIRLRYMRINKALKPIVLKKLTNNGAIMNQSLVENCA